MALLTAPFPQNDPTALAKLVLSGMSQLQENLKAQQDISQNEQENFLAQSKMAASNVMNIANIQANNREAARRSSQDAFSNMIGLQELGMKQTEAGGLNAERAARTSLLTRQLNAPPLAPDAPAGTPYNGGAGTPTLISGNAGAPPSDMAAPNMAGQPRQAPGVTVDNGLLAPDQPPTQTSPLMMSQDLAAGATAGANSAVGSGAGNAAPAILTQGMGGQTPGLLMQTPAPTAPGVPAPAQPPAPAAKAPDVSKTPWITPGGGIDYAKIPYDTPFNSGGAQAVERRKVGDVDVLQYFDKVPRKNPDGTPATPSLKPIGPPHAVTSSLAAASTGIPAQDFAKIPEGTMTWAGGDEFVMRQKVGDDYQLQYFKGSKPVVQNGKQAVGPNGAPQFSAFEMHDAPKTIAKTITPGEKLEANPVFNSDGQKVGDYFKRGSKEFYHPLTEKEMGGVKAAKPLSTADVNSLDKMEKEMGGNVGPIGDRLATIYNAANKSDNPVKADAMTNDQKGAAIRILKDREDKLQTAVKALYDSGKIISARYQKYLPPDAQKLPVPPSSAFSSNAGQQQPGPVTAPPSAPVAPTAPAPVAQTAPPNNPLLKYYKGTTSGASDTEED